MSIELERCFLLHQRPYRETSVIAELLTEHEGRVSLVCKGVRSAGKKASSLRSTLQPFALLNASWSGKTDLKSLRQAEVITPAPRLHQSQLYSGLYLNELLFRLFHSGESHINLFSRYQASISDLASLKTKAVEDGDNFIVNGQKVWTSYADECDMIFTLVRTGPQEPKHNGISFLLIDMDQPGVETKPIKLISGKSPFCETFFTDAVVPKANLVHDLNKGWDVAKNLLQHERKMLASMGLGGSAAGGKGKGKSGSGLANLSNIYVESSDGKISDEGLRQKIAKSDMDAHAFGLTLRRASEEAKNSNHGPSAATSIFKFFGSEHNKRRYEIMLEAMGTQALGLEGGEFGPEELAVTREWLRTKANSIEGGTSEVQLNVISKRVLDLPQ